MLFVLYIAAFLDRTNVSLAALQMNQDLGLSAAAYGFGAGVFFIGYGLFEVPSNLFLARVGARRVDCADRDHVGHSRVRDDVRARPDELLRAALSARRGGSGCFPGHRVLSQPVVSRAAARERDVALHGEHSARERDRRTARRRAARR